MKSERIIFQEEDFIGQHVKVLSLGEISESLLEALETFIAHQRKREKISHQYALEL